jgi:hypothetical protein
MNTLKMLNRATRKLALHFALNPTATIMHAPKPTRETTTRERDQVPWKMKPMKRKMRRIRPASWMLHASRRSQLRLGGLGGGYVGANSLLSPVSLAQTGKTSEQLLLVLK